MMVQLAFKDSAQITVDFWGLPNPFRWENIAFGFTVTIGCIANSMLVSGLVCALTLVLAALAAYSFSHLRFCGSEAVFLLVVGLLMVPGVLVLVPLFLTTRDLGLINSYWGLILPQVAGGLPLGILFLRSFFDGLPADLFDAARIDGASEASVLRHVVTPLSKPILSTVAVLNILATWNNYVWPLVVLRDALLRTIPLGLAFLVTEYDLQRQPCKQMAAFAVASIPMIVCFLVAMRPFMRGITSGALKA
ncbi:MAG: carbohydrate ABC transporter permease [Candidatus Sumerlaeota bacterium]|nr:carbohydrate ABC transporter permease [Candidatus Sumerlaeota bacterium]